MNIDEVLLTGAERNYLIGRLVVENQVWKERNEAVCKAQCLKLLDVLKKPCIHGLDKIIGGYRDIGDNRITMNCLECMTEIEKLLKEG